MKTTILNIVCFFSIVAGSGLASGESAEDRIDRGRALLNGEKREEGRKLILAAIEDLKAEISKSLDAANLHFSAGRAYFYLEMDKEALACLSRAAALDPKDPEPIFYTGLISMYAGRGGDAEKCFREAWKLAPKEAKYGIEIGKALLRQDREADAQEVFEKVLESNPGNPGAMYHLGNILFGQEKTKEALVLFEKSVAVAPDIVDYSYNAGLASQILGLHEKALTHFRRVVEIAPEDWQALSKVIQELQALGRLEERDKSRDALLNLRKQGKIESLKKAEAYTREQFEESGKKVMVREYFEMTGDWARRYVFYVLDEKGEKDFEISMGSYPTTHAIAKEHGLVSGDQRYCHLDGYFKGGEHRTYDFYAGEPTYDKVREHVVLILQGKKQATSGFKPGKGD